MRVSIKDKSVLSEVSVIHLQKYLLNFGWTKKSENNKFSDIWLKNGAELIVPLDSHVKDFVTRVMDVLVTLEQVECRSQIEILHDLFAANADVTRIKPNYDKGQDGSIPLRDGIELFEKAKEMYQSSASSVINKRKVFMTRAPQKVQDYVNNLRLGQTEHGSYVISIISPLNPSDELQTSIVDTNVPFERLVTRTLSESLSVMIPAVNYYESTGRIDQLEEGVGKGLSANLFEAIAEMGTVDNTHVGLRIAFKWAWKTQFETSIPSKFDIEARQISPLREVAKTFRASSDPEEFVLIGPVVRLQRNENEESGIVTIHSSIHNSIRNINIELGDPQYGRAVDAHKAFKSLKCKGMIIQQGRNYSLINPTEVKILDENEDQIGFDF